MSHTRAAVTIFPARIAPVLAAMVVAVLLAACSPHMEAAGPAVVAPALNDDHVLAADGVRLPLRVWPAEGETRAAVVALHGFNDYSNAFEEPARYWARRGIATYAYDQRGFGATEMHGLWPGTDAMAGDLAAVARLVAAKYPGVPLYLVGESMGGAVIMVAMARADAPPVDGIVLAAPAVWGWRTMNPFYKMALWLGAHIRPSGKLTGKGLGIKPSDNRDMLLALSRDPLIVKATRIDAMYGLVTLMDEAFAAAKDLSVPTLMLYGANDEIIPRDPTFDMLRTLAAPHRVAVYGDGFHMLLRDLQAETVLADIAAWIADPAAPLPSGEERVGERIFAGE